MVLHANRNWQLVCVEIGRGEGVFVLLHCFFISFCMFELTRDYLLFTWIFLLIALVYFYNSFVVLHYFFHTCYRHHLDVEITVNQVQFVKIIEVLFLHNVHRST
jgi:hypothetical protein